MTLHGYVHNGQIILSPGAPLPEGAEVQVHVVAPQSTADAAPAAEEVVINPSAGNEIPTLAERLKDFIGVLDDLPEDAALNHDHYLYGAPKKS